MPEKAFALLGQGRCVIGLSRPTEAATILQHAREIPTEFERTTRIGRERATVG